MKRTVLERTVVASCLQALACYQVWAWRNNTGAVQVGGRFVRFGVPGASDIFGVIPRSGRFLAVECKRPEGGRLSPEQTAFLAEIRKANGVALVVRDVNDLVRALDVLAEDPWAELETKP